MGSAVQYPSTEAAGRFQTRCRDIGRQLLLSQRVSDNKVDERTLGYGNNAYLLSLPVQRANCNAHSVVE